ncbi:DUF6904 family protein [Pseudomonas aeruginosa]|uniref:DUF6904 family protein n=1 Tax=Pseudomonas aeruginosa TaxID=287 RepID=UPI002E2D8FF5|nr:hypothetical protein [Pseudomonas aeruginosa]
MLEYKLTPHHAGVALWGDFAALDKLHEFIHHVVEESVYIEDKEGFVLGLAYDVRKAFQGQRTQGYRSYSGLYAGIPEISVSPAPVPPRAHPGR